MFFLYELFKWLFKPSERVTKALAQTVVDAKPVPANPASNPTPDSPPATVPVAVSSPAKQLEGGDEGK